MPRTTAALEIMENNFYVYFLRRPDKEDPLGTGNGCPFYIGKGNNGRYLDHRREAKLLLYKQQKKSIKIKIIHKLWKQGLDFVEDIFCENLTQQEAFELEAEAIQIYGRINLETGCLFNMTNGGEGCTGLIHTDETKELWSEIRKGRPAWNKGIKNPYEISLETRAKIAASNKGRIVTQDTRDKIANTLNGHEVSQETRDKIGATSKGRSHPYKGKTGLFKHTPETIEKMRKSHKEIELWNRGKKLGPLPQETKDKIAEKMRAVWRERKCQELPPQK